MSIFIIDFGLDKNKTLMLQDICKYIYLFIAIHILVNLSELKNLGLCSNKLFNENFIVFLLLLAIAIMSYYLVLLELIEIK